MKRLIILFSIAILAFPLFWSCSEKEIPVASVTLSQPAAEMFIGESITLKAIISPSDATVIEVIWASSKQSVASVDQSGKVVAIAEGTSTITATVGGKMGSCVVTVSKRFVDVSSINLDKTSASLKVGEKVTLTATVKPDDATDKTVTWSTSDASVATVDNGVVTAIKLGSATITAKAGEKTAICAVTVKSEVTADPFTITSSGSTTVSIAKQQFPYDITLEYRKGAGDWSEYRIGSTISLVDGEFVQFIAGEGGNANFSKGPFFRNYYNFDVSGSGTVKISGNIMSLLDKTGERTTMPEYGFHMLFHGCTNLVDASKLKLSATTLASNCYSYMFYECTELTTAPVLPSTILAEACYADMFSHTGLTTAPQLPATTLAESCYQNMFYACTGLTTAPVLPATTLAQGCYCQMFENTGLTTAPELPATTLAESCYEGMFARCTGLTQAPELPATTLAESCYRSMFIMCTGLTTAPELPVTTLAESCYSGMFSMCTGLTTAPELPATTLAERCYYWMFFECTGLTTAPELPATTLASQCYNFMFDSCTGLTTAPELPATTLAEWCYACMFDCCIGLTTAPELPATTLAQGCYCQMFSNTGLTTAPVLPATTLAESCYSEMFWGCGNLNYIKMLATDISANASLVDWVAGVSATGTFVKSKNATWDVTGDNGIPSGWTVQTE